MKSIKQTLFLPLFVVGAMLIAFTSCEKDDNNPDDDNSQIPDIHYQFTVTGDHSQHEEIHIPGGIQSDYTATGSYESQTGLMSVLFQQSHGGWFVGLFVAETNFPDAGGTFPLNEHPRCVFAQIGYKATSGSLSFSKVDFFVENSNGQSQYFVDGTFSGTFEEVDPDLPNPPRVIKITGEFSGVPFISL